MSSAYTNRNTSGNDFYLAWQDMTATSDLNSILPPGSTAFWNTGGPTANEADVLLFRDWLQDNPVTAGRLGLEPTISFRSDLRTQLGNAGNVGTEKRRWKGSPLYTFANGVLVGKDGNIAAAIGTEGGTDIEGFGTDTITYFDGIPFSTGTGIPGSTVIGGDAVVSGSIRGTGGVVVIPDVIQLEQDDTITAPAGIGVDKDGKIRLRHRGEGFLDLVDEIATAETDATNAAKVFTAAQNTSSGRFGMSLIPNSNFSYKSIDPTTFAETFANIISVGTTSNILSESSPGVGEFEANAGGICFSAFPTTSERYAVRIRFEGDVAETADDTSIPEGLFVTFNETTDDLPDGKYYVFNDNNIGPSSGDYQGSEVHTANVSVVTPMLSDGGYATTDAGGNIDGLTVPSSMAVSSFLYKPSAGAKNASMVIFAKNFGNGSDRSIRIDYIVLNESPQTTTEIEGIVGLAVTDITGEDDISIVPDKNMADKDMWATRGTSVTLTDSDDGGDPAEDAIQAVFANASGGGIISSAIQCESDRYLVGCKIKVTDASSGDPVISMFAIENLTASYPTIAGADTSPITTGNEVGFDIMEVTSNNNYLGTSNSSVTLTDDGNFHTLLGTYETTVKYMDDQGTEYETYDPSRTPHGTTPILLPSVFSLGIQVDRPCTLLIDYVYGRVQGSSVNIVEGLATAAYTDAEGFVTAMNELVIKESGSIINNSSMGLLDSSGLPLGWMTNTDCTMTFDNTGDYAITITREGSGNRRLITPTFAMGTADKFSIGIRIKSTDSTGIAPTINTVTTAADVLPTGYVTMNNEAGGYPTKVYTTGVSQHTTGITMSPSSGITSYDTMLGTWERTSAGQEQSFVGGLAAIVIDCADDFTVDYIFVKEQTVSYDLADARAEARKDEAIAQAAGFVVDIGDTIAQESGSLLTNADFNSWYKENTYQRPQKWLVTRGATNPRRVIRSTEVSNEVYNAMADPVTGISTARDAEVVDNVNQTGSSIRFSPSTGSGGILSAKWQLPLSDPAAVTAGETTTGAYTVSARVKVGSSSVIGVRIYAHESFDYPNASQEHVFCEDGTYGSATVEGADRTSTGTPLDSLFMFADGATTGQVTRVGVINISNPNDTTPGYDPNYTDDDVDNDYAEAGDDQFVEYIPIDNNGMGGYEDGDLDATIENTGLWYSIGGTFKPDGKTKCVSFEILIDGDPDTAGGAPTDVYVDYVSLIQQPFDADFATTLADARVNSITGISDESFGSSTDPSTGATNTTLAAAILANQTRIYNAQQALAAEDETTTLIPNSFFGSPTSGTTPDNWLATRNTDATIVREMNTANWATAGSYNSYITMGGTDDTRGILSKAISVIGDGGENTLGLTQGQLTQNPNFDIAIRYKAATGTVSSTTNGLDVDATTATNTSTVAATSDAPTSVVNGSGGSLTINEVTTGIYDVGRDTRTAEWNITYGSGALNVSQSQVTELILAFRVNDSNAEADPKMEFLDSNNNPVYTSGSVEIWNASNTKLHDNEWTSQSSIINWDDPTEDTNKGTFLAGGTDPSVDAPPYWVVVKITTNARLIDKVKFTGQDTGADNMPMRHMNMFCSIFNTEPITFSIIAHEYFNDQYDNSTYSYVYSGPSYASGATGVQEFNTGFQGAQTPVGAILNDGVDTTVETSTVTDSGAWQTLVGLYTPHTLARWVSFEFVIDHDQDNDDALPSVYVDGLLLQASQETPLLQSVKETAEAASVAAGNAVSTANNAATDVAELDLAQTEAAIVQAGIASESGSLINNAGFGQAWSDTQKISPSGFFPYLYTPQIIRVQNTDSTASAYGTGGWSWNAGMFQYTKDETQYLDVGQTGTAIVALTTRAFDPYVAGFYTSAMTLPSVTATVIDDTTGASSTETSRGAYSVAIKVKPGGTVPVGISIYAHEYDADIAPVNAGGYITSNTNTDYKGFGVRSQYAGSYSGDRIRSFYLTKLSDSTDTTSATLEVIPVGSWTTVGGTYTPSSTAQCVSFSIFITFDTDDESHDTTASNQPDGTTAGHGWTWSGISYDLYPAAYIDYILVTPATVSADMATNIAAGKAYEVQQTLTATIESVEEGINEQTPGLIFNSDFKNIISSGSKAKGWLMAGSNNTFVESKDYSSAVGSVDRYVHLEKEGTSEVVSILSQGVGSIADESRNSDGSLGTYVIAVKARGKYTDGTNTFDGTGPTSSDLSAYQVHRVSGGTSSSGQTSNAVFPTDAGSYQGWYDSDTYELNETGSTTVYRRFPTAGGTHDGVYKLPIPGTRVKVWATISWDGVDTSGDNIGIFAVVDPEGTPTQAASSRLASVLKNNGSTEAGGGTSVTVTNYESFSLRNVNNTESPSGQFFIEFTLTSDEQIEGFRIVTSNLDSGEVFYFGAVYQAYSQTNLDGDWSVQMIAHESNSPGDATHVIPSGLTYETPHADLGITTTVADNSFDLTIIDLGYGSAEADTEAEILNEESSLTSWRTVIGSYKPTSNNRSMTSFEFKFDLDEDGDNLQQQVFIDSVTLQKSSIDGDVAETIAENRVFLESNQTMGGATVSNNNILFNADFSMPQGETSDTRSPAGWYPLRAYNGTEISIATPLAYEGSNRDLRFSTSEECHGFVSKAFSIDYDKYRVRLTLDLNGASETSILIKYWATTNTPTFLQKCVCVSNVWPSISSEISYHAATTSGNVQAGISSGSGVYTVEYEWNPYGTNDNWEDAWNWASIGVYFNSSSAVEVIVKSLELYPIGHPFTRTALGRGSITRTFGGGIFDLGGRSQFYETDVPEPLYDAIDIAVDTDTSVTQALLMSEVRYEHDDSSGTNPTAKYKYPAESPVEISDASTRTTITVKPDDKYNTLKGLQYIHMDSNNGSVAARIDGNSYGLVLAGSPTPSATPSEQSAVVTTLGPHVVASQPPYFWGHEDQWMNGTTGIFLQQQGNAANKGLLIQNPHVDTDSNDSGTGVDNYPTWSIYIGSTERYIRFAYGTTADGLDGGDHWYMKAEQYTSGQTSSNNDNPRSIGQYLSSYTFTGAHISLPSQEDPFEIGMIVISSGKYNNISFLEGHPLSEKASISESLPTVLLASKRNQKSVFGVVAEIEDPEENVRKLNNHNALGRAQTKEDNRLIVNSLGEGAVWICNINGNLENGDYITTCEIPGYGMLQDDDLLHNYTVAKITQDCNFELNNPYYDCVEFEFEGNTYRKAFVGCTYHCG